MNVHVCAGLLDSQVAQFIQLKQKQEFINSCMQASDFKPKVKQFEREKAANTKKQMLLSENEHLQSTLRIRISRKEVLQDNKKEIEGLQENISSISVQLLEKQISNFYNREVKSTQTVLSPNGSICEAQDDYNDPVISFKKDELLQLSTNGHEVQSLETGQKSAVPMKYIGYSRVELLYLFQFTITKGGLSLLPVILDDDKKAESFILKITNDPTLLQSLRKLITKDKLFMASYNFEGLRPHDLTLKKGEVLEVVKYDDDDEWWYMYSLRTDKEGYVPINYILPIEGKYSPMYYKYIYYHTVSRDEAEERLSQADTQAGTFLIRHSESNPRQHYSLSLNDGAAITHYRIYMYIQKNKYYMNPRVQFDSLNDLVHYYMMKADGLPCSLTVPIFKQVSIPIAKNEEWKINKSSIKFEQCINAGRFGETWKGNCKGKGPVMIKTNIATDITQETFIEEAKILVKFYHKNIISLYGVCIEDYPFYIVTEPMNGNLKDYLTTKYLVTSAELVDIAIQVTKGMMYLGEQGYIHCDLRAENILLRDHNTVKIANFHLAQHLNGSKYSTVEGTKLAIRWTAPEAYTLNQLSIKSDVWSFGILLWELVTKGKEPYSGMTDEDVKEAVSKGYHMLLPQGCPEPFKQLMLNCWKQNKDKRPSFKNIFDLLMKYDTHDT
ncbi:PREDICTED: tyrosine-protein kinase STK-like [Amphimedon queenslandica]|uniref:Tyrosine-protein kinase n=2 Tax=Amphimedon queenslandica TaxID=400682 RepID=A0AAN0JW18_AMPQE|nr:PREDICTED: tyrosine-protein kinase STK-like [Amphimedon queenslandica]|eukprot:XP_019861264.1 PREDICTED: tyrosine-protein kinase STK-like [Amphimedon queenslandica]